MNLFKYEVENAYMGCAERFEEIYLENERSLNQHQQP